MSWSIGTINCSKLSIIKHDYVHDLVVLKNPGSTGAMMGDIRAAAQAWLRLWSVHCMSK